MTSQRLSHGEPLVAVTGGRGMIGRVTQRELERRGIPFRTLGRTPPEQPDPRHLVGSTTDPNAVAALLHGATALFHLARTTHDLKDMCPFDYLSMMTLLPLAVERGLEIHFTSTQMVQDQARRYPLDVIDEDYPCEPFDPYGAMKLAWEKTLDCFRKTHGLRYITYRFPTVVPPELSAGWGVARFLKRGMETGVISPADEKERFGGHSIIHAEQAAAVMADNIGNTAAQGRVYNLCCDDYLWNRDLAALSAEILTARGRPARLDWDMAGAPGPGFSSPQAFSNARARFHLGFRDEGPALLRRKLKRALSP